MSRYARRLQESVEEVVEWVWACTAENCSVWMRNKFSFQENPQCPMCSSDMNRELKKVYNGSMKHWV